MNRREAHSRIERRRVIWCIPWRQAGRQPTPGWRGRSSVREDNEENGGGCELVVLVVPGAGGEEGPINRGGEIGANGASDLLPFLAASPSRSLFLGRF
jgi:hypothetical protein